MQEIISVIVPVYNTSKFLDTCICSILNQTNRAFELILIEDGSADDSLLICQKYAQKDSRIRLIAQENRGLSAARNRGLDIAKGAYIMFVDSDDYIEKDMLQSMYDLIIKENADMCACGVYRVKKHKKEPNKNIIKASMTGEMFFKEALIGKDVSVIACAKLYKKECFETLRFPEGKVMEDAYISVDLFPKMKKVVVDTTPKYNYLLRKGSITTENFSEKNYDLITAFERVDAIVRKKYSACVEASSMRVIWSCFTVYDKMIFAHEERQKDILREIKKRWKDILLNPYIFRSRKCGFVVLCISPKLYKKIAQKYLERISEGEV